MGISIHFRGSLTDKKQIYPFIHELEDIAQSIGGKCRVYDEDWCTKPTARMEPNSAGQFSIEGTCSIKGVMLQLHEKSETLPFCFSASGLLTSPISVAFSADTDYAVSPDEWLSVKTQFAGPDVHVAISELLRYLKQKYIHDLEVHDESSYWETKDYAALKNRMSFIERGIDAISNRLETVPLESKDDIIRQIEIALQKMKDHEDNQNH